MTIEIIAAISNDMALGKNNELLWSIPEDMQHFKMLTMGHPVIMGRKTWESLPERFRPLPNRHNIVITTQEEYVADGAVVVHSMEDAILLGDGRIFVIGGAQIYNEALPYADVIHLTIVDVDVPDADVFFPDFDQVDFDLVSIVFSKNKEYDYVFAKFKKCLPRNNIHV